jgi:hypothetical protein
MAESGLLAKRHNVALLLPRPAQRLNLYVRGWLNYDKLSSTYSEVKALAQ